MIHINSLKFQNKDAAENLIRYITRTREEEYRRDDLLLYGSSSGYTYHKPVDHIIQEFEYIQKFYKAKGALMCHYVIQISPQNYARMNNDINTLGNFATECCRYLFQMGHQACFAIHYPQGGKLHIHLAINTVNFNTGYKIRQYPAEIKKNIEIPIQNIFKNYTYQQSIF